MRDSIEMRGFNDFGKMNRKFILGVDGYRAPTEEIVKEAFRNAGLWPMDLGFMENVSQKEVTDG